MALVRPGEGDAPEHPVAPWGDLQMTYAEDLPELVLWWQGDEVPRPELAVLNEDLAAELDMSVEALRSDDGVGILSGSRAIEGTGSAALAYAGHQFGQYSPRLGDGRALLLGELVGPDGRRLDLHLKGSGRTPFARGGDGKATIGPMLREYVIAEAMHALGVPTTRSLSVCTTGESIPRDRVEPGAVLARTAASQARRLLDRAAPSPRRRGTGAVPRLPCGGGRGSGRADLTVDAHRVRARRHEHRQHDDLR